MIYKFVRAGLWPLLTTALLAATAPASSQAPTDAQRAAIKSQCRSDYIAHCSSIPPGGAASLQCLQKNMASLSASCQSAVKSVEASVEPKAEAKPESKPLPRRPLQPQSRTRRQPSRRPSPRQRRSQTPSLHLPQQPRQPRSRPLARCKESRATHRLPRSAALAAPTIREYVPAFPLAAPRPCNAWKRTRQDFRRLADRPSLRRAAAPRQPAPLRQQTRMPHLPRLRRHLRWCSGNSVRAR